MITTTYKELFEKYATGDKQDEFYTCAHDDIYISTPTGPSKINGVFQKEGKGLICEVEGGKIIHGERRHTVLSSSGWEFLEDAEDIQDETGNFRKIISKTPSDETKFYDICIDYPHAYYDTQGLVHHNTYTIMKTVEEAGLVKGKDYVKLSGKASPIAIYETLFMFRDGGLVIFDDLDSMWGDKEATNILKAALDTSPVREISWASANTINVSKMSDEKREQLFKQIDRDLHGPSDDEIDDILDDDDDEDSDDGDKKKKKPKKATKIKFPSTFNFKGRVIFISNLKKEEFDSAIMSRSAKIGMDMTPEQILMRMRSILPSLGGDDVPVDQKEELIKVLIKLNEDGELDQVTMREFTKGLDILRSGAPNWKELVIYA